MPLEWRLVPFSGYEEYRASWERWLRSLGLPEERVQWFLKRPAPLREFLFAVMNCRPTDPGYRGLNNQTENVQ